MNERVSHPISTQELQRRWGLVRAAMAERKIAALLLNANNDFMGGYIKYLTDIPATNGYPVTVVFPADADMVVIGQGQFGMVKQLPPGGDDVRRGVATFMGTPSYATVGYTNRYDSELAAKALQKYARGTIGIVAPGAMAYSLLDDLKRDLPGAAWVDATDMVDAIKVIKSAEEIDFMRRAAQMQDAGWQAVLDTIRPGMRDIEVAGIAEQAGRRMGSEQGLFLCASGPVGTAAMFGNRHLQNRVIQEGDYFSLLIESSGPGGFFTELGRTCVLGKASQQMLEEQDMVLRARAFTLERLVPGATGQSVWEAYNAFLREQGRPEENRLHCHGQGYDMVERPLVRFDESMTLAADMVLACHPTYLTASTFSWICDNFHVGPQGVTERLHRTDEKIFEL